MVVNRQSKHPRRSI